MLPAGKYADARAAFQKAASVSPAEENRNRALRAIAISYGFQSDCPNVVKYEQPLYEQYVTALEYYRKVLASTTHNPRTAASRPAAKRKLRELGGTH